MAPLCAFLSMEQHIKIMTFLDAEVQYGRKSILRKNAIEFYPEDCSWYQSNISDESMLFHAEVVMLAHLSTEE